MPGSVCRMPEIIMRYRAFTKFIHRVIIFLRMDGLTTRVPEKNRVFRKLVPGNSVYRSRLRKIKRDHAWFELDLSDYMQWHIFSREKEIAWKIAMSALPKGSKAVIMDIGSNVGAFTIKIACNSRDHENLKLFAFDPNPFIEKKFRRNVELNQDIARKISFELAAVGNENKWEDFSFESANTGAGKIGNKSENAFRTKVVTIDSFVDENKITDIRFIKIDVEGFEPFVFEGAKNTIRQQKPNLYFEVTETWHNNYGRSAMEIFDFLKDTGYTIYIDRNHQLQEVTDCRAELASGFQHNFFAEYK